MSGIVSSLATQLRNQGIHVLQVDLYQLSMQLLRDRGVLHTLIEQEANLGQDQVLELLRNVLNPQTHLVPAIGKLIADQRPQVMLVSGVGPVYPFIRSHAVLNNLQDVAKDFSHSHVLSRRVCSHGRGWFLPQPLWHLDR